MLHPVRVIGTETARNPSELRGEAAARGLPVSTSRSAQRERELPGRAIARARRALVLLATLLAAGGAPTASAEDGGARLELVRFARPVPAPPFTLPRLDGGEVSLAAQRGRHVLVNFWATWCPPCLAEMPSIEALHSHFAGHPLEVIAVASAEEAPVVRPFVERLGVTFTVAVDADGAVSRRYGARELPVTFVLDPEGRIVAAARGERDWSSDQARAYFEQLLAGR